MSWNWSEFDNEINDCCIRELQNRTDEKKYGCGCCGTIWKVTDDV